MTAPIPLLHIVEHRQRHIGRVYTVLAQQLHDPLAFLHREVYVIGIAVVVDAERDAQAAHFLRFRLKWPSSKP